MAKPRSTFNLWVAEQPPRPPRKPRKRPRLAVVEPLGVPTLQLTASHCRFPVASDAAIIGLHLFCGRPKPIGRSYCEAHHRAAYAGLPRR